MSKSARIAIVAVATIAVVFCAGSYAFDRFLLAQTYARMTDAKPSLLLTDADIAADYPYDDVEFQIGDYTLRGHVYGAGSTQGLIIVRHGIFSQHQDYLALITALVDRGWKVFAYDAIGCGESDGDSVLGFAQSPIDVRAAVQFASESSMADGMPIMLLGHSWGGYGVASSLGYPDVSERVSACVSMSGFDTPTDIIVGSATSSFGPIAAVERPFIELIGYQDFGDDANRSGSHSILESNVPTLVIHGTGDAVISYDDMSIISKLQNTTDSDVSLITKSEEGRDGHNTYFYSPESTTYLHECNQQLQDLASQYDGGIPSDVLDEFMASIDKRRANTADPVLIDEIDSFFRAEL